jgi:eukaryotic-like serine/threonine-protein kinase
MNELPGPRDQKTAGNADVATPHARTTALPEKTVADGKDVARKKVPDTFSASGEIEQTASWQPGDTPEPPVATTLRDVPRKIAGYEILGVLGRGGMGVVYKARQPGLKRLVALKMVLAGGHAGPQELLRFRREAEAVARLQHPNIVQIYEVGEEDGRPYFSLEYVDGPTLRDKLAGQPMPQMEAAALVETLARTMAYAHQRAIVHRDLKPSNILITADGVPKIADFGLVKTLDADGEPTESGKVLGTPDYMAPEQAAGKISQIGPATDIYALGGILYVLLTGRPPFRSAAVMDTLVQIMTADPVPPRRLDPTLRRDLETICLKCLNKVPGKRYASASDLAEDLRRFQAGEVILARPASTTERAWRWCRRNPRVAGLMATVALVLVGWAVTATGLVLRLDKALDAAESSAFKASLAAEEAKEKEALALSNARKAEDAMEVAKRQHTETGKIFDELLKRQKNGENVTDLLAGAAQKLAADVEETGGISKFAQVNYWHILGDGELRRGHGNEALNYFQRAYARTKQVVDEDPGNDQARGNFGVAAHRIGKAYLEFFDDAHKARPYLVEGRDSQQQVADHPNPEKPFFAADDNDRILAMHELYIGMADLRLGHPSEAKERFEAALVHREHWLERNPSSVPIHSLVSQCHLWLGAASAHLGDDAGVEKQYGEALKTCHELEDRFPGDFTFKEDLGQVYGEYGDAQLRAGNIDAASGSYENSLAYVQRVIAHWSDDVSRKPQLAEALERMAIIAERRHDEAAAKNDYEQTRKIRAQLVENDPKNFAWRLAYARVLAHCGQAIEAYLQATEALTAAGDRPSAQLQAARVFAVCAAKGTSPDERASDARRALDALDHALADDFHDPCVIRTDPDLATLSDEPRYQAILARIATPEVEEK